MKLSPVWLVLLTAIVSVLLYRTLFPPKPIPPVIPNIITRYDTVNVLPKWFKDSVKVWSKGKHTTDTVNLTVSQTIVDTEYVNVTSPPEERADLWPVLSYRGSAKFGDTSTVSAFSIKSGKLGISRIFQAGILTAIEVDSGQVTPKFTFAPFPAQKGTSLFQRLKLIGIGAAGMAIFCSVTACG